MQSLTQQQQRQAPSSSWFVYPTPDGTPASKCHAMHSAVLVFTCSAKHAQVDIVEQPHALLPTTFALGILLHTLLHTLPQPSIHCLAVIVLHLQLLQLPRQATPRTATAMAMAMPAVMLMLSLLKTTQDWSLHQHPSPAPSPGMVATEAAARQLATTRTWTTAQRPSMCPRCKPRRCPDVAGVQVGLYEKAPWLWPRHTHACGSSAHPSAGVQMQVLCGLKTWPVSPTC